MDVPFTDTYVEAWVVVAAIAGAIVVIAAVIALIVAARKRGKHEYVETRREQQAVGAHANGNGRAGTGNGRAPLAGRTVAQAQQQDGWLRTTRRELTDDEREHFSERWMM